MAASIFVFDSVEDLGRYVHQVELASLSANIITVHIKKAKFWVIGEDLPTPSLDGITNDHARIRFDEASLQAFLEGATLPSTYNIKNIGAQYAVAGITGEVFSGEVQDVFDKMGVLTEAEQNAIAVFVDSQSAGGTGGNWGTKAAGYADSRMDYFAHYGLTTEANALISWRNTFTGVPAAAPVHTAGIGYSFNGTTQYIDSAFNGSTQGIVFLPDDAQVGIFIAQHTDPSVDSMITGVSDGTNQIRIRNITAVSGDYLLNATGSVGTFSEALEADTLYSVLREGAGAQRLLKNGVQLDSVPAPASVARPAANIFVGARQALGVGEFFFNGQISSVIFGSAIGFDHVSFYNDLVTLNAALTP